MNRLAGILATLATLAAGLAGGLALTSTLLDAAQAPGTARLGAWSLWARAGAPDADPYTRALFARRGEVAMAPAEGLALHAQRDSAGGELDARCAYRLTGSIPPARAWTLTVYRPDGSLAANPADRHGLTSAEVVGGGQETIMVAAEPRPGNWLPLPTEGRVHLVLRLYDTPLSAIAAAIDPARLPRIERLECRP